MSEKRQSLPTTASLRPDAVDAYVQKWVLTGNPFTYLFPVAGVLVAGGGFALTQLLELWMILVAGGGVGLGVLSFAAGATIYRENVKDRYLEMINRQLEGQADQLAMWLTSEFVALQSERGSGLVTRLDTHVRMLEDVLDDKFEPGESTHKHFHTTVESLRVGTLNCLKDAATQIKANAAVDIGYVSQMVKQTSGTEQSDFQRKLNLHAEGTKRVDELFASAETAITGLTELGQNVAGIQSGNMAGFDKFLNQVDSLAERAGFYVDERSI